MGYQNSITGSWQRCTTMSTTLGYWFHPRWQLAAGVDNLRPVLKNKNVIGNFTSQPCIQVASVREDDPGSITVLDSLRGSGEWNPGSIPVSTQTGPVWLWRLGFAYALSSGSALGQADTSVEATWTTSGLQVGSKTLSLFAASTSNGFAEVTGWVPVQWAAKVKAALIARSLSGNFQYRICYRTADTSVDSPGAWSTTFDSSRTGGEACTGDVTLTFTNETWVQFGIQYSLSGATPGGAIITASFAVR